MGIIWIGTAAACDRSEPAAQSQEPSRAAGDAQVQPDDTRADAGVEDEASAAPPASDAGVGGHPPTGELLALRDLPYALPPGVRSELATLDLFRVDDGEVRPLVMLVHGGSWAAGDKAGFEQRIVPWFVDEGYVAAPVNFRLATKKGEAPPVKPADQARDIAAALGWLVGEAGSYGVDPDHIILMGYSSGAHLVALLGTDERYLIDAGVEPNQVRGVISLDVHAYDVPYALELMVGSVVAQNQGIIRHLFGDTEEEQLAGSPISYLDGWAAPALVISVDADPAVEGTHGYIVSKAATRYVNALQAAGHGAETIHDMSETHASLVNEYGAAGDLATATIRAFLAARFR